MIHCLPSVTPHNSLWDTIDGSFNLRTRNKKLASRSFDVVILAKCYILDKNHLKSTGLEALRLVGYFELKILVGYFSSIINGLQDHIVFEFLFRTIRAH